MSLIADFELVLPPAHPYLTPFSPPGRDGLCCNCQKCANQDESNAGGRELL